MAFIDTEKLFPTPGTGYNSRNGTIPDAITMRRVVEGIVHWLQMQKRCVFWKMRRGYSNSGGSQTDYFAGTNNQITDQFAFHVHTSHGTKVLKFVTMILGSDSGNVGVPRFQWQDTTGGGDDLDIMYLPDADDTATDIRTIKEYPQWLVVDEDTDYYFNLMTDNMARVFAVGVFEERNLTANEESAAGIAKRAYASGEPVADEHIGEVLALAEKLWERNSAHIFSWAAETDQTAVLADISITSTTDVNVFDTATTSHSSSSVGVTVNTQYMGTRHDAFAVPIRMAVRAKVDGGTGEVKLIDGSGARATATVTATSYTWYTVSGDLIDQSGGHKVDFHANVTSTNTLDINAIQLFYYL